MVSDELLGVHGRDRRLVIKRYFKDPPLNIQGLIGRFEEREKSSGINRSRSNNDKEIIRTFFTQDLRESKDNVGV